MTNLSELAQNLHPLEKKLVPFLKEGINITELVEKSKLKDVEVVRALQWLQNKQALTLNVEEKEIITLEKTGEEYKKTGLPEQKFIQSLKDGAKTLSEIQKQTKLSPQETNSCLGLLKKNQLVNITKEKELIITLTGKNPAFPEEQLLKKNYPLEKSQLTTEEKIILENLKKRNIIKSQLKKIKTVQLTNLGKELLKQKITNNVIESLTPQLLKSRSWKEKTFRKYDVKINVPKIYGGKRHFVKQAIRYAKNIWLEMGFQEMQGSIVQTSFWNFDVLFTAQDHPVRDMQDTFFIKNPSLGKLPDNKLVKRVQEAHETGGKTKSQGWNYKWDPKEAEKNVLRTHTTVLSVQTIAKLKESDLPIKLFSVGKCFRNEAIDWCHLAEFNQTEGIVIDPNANFRHLLGYLKEFFKKMGFPKARFRPAFFPYTSPSVEIDVYHPVHKKWIELGGAGMFRPEVVIPLLGKDVPVLAWGPGFDRIILDYYKIKDIRELYKNDLEQLRTTKMWLK